MKKKTKPPDVKISGKKIADLAKFIKDNGSNLTQKKITAGFDGFIDTIVKVIKKKQTGKPTSLFTTIKEFGEYIIEKQGASLSLEIEERSSKIGGNMPIMANALGQLGVTVNCVGALGYPQLYPVFKNLSSNCHHYSFADPGTTTAFEFNNGKIMMAQMAELNSFGWDKIKGRIGIDTLISIYKQSDLICMLNWSEIDASTDIWKGVLKDVLTGYSFTGEQQIAFFDLSDCSKRSTGSIKEAIQLLREFAKHTKVVLSLNKNEACILYKIVGGRSLKKDLSEIGKWVFEKTGVHTLVVHSPKKVTVFTAEEMVINNTFFIPDPKISTGAGDNFNAGFCAAQLLKLDLEPSVIFANSVSGYYVRTGTSARVNDIIDFLETTQKSN